MFLSKRIKKKNNHFFFLGITIFLSFFSFQGQTVDTLNADSAETEYNIKDFEALVYGKFEIPRANPLLTKILVEHEDYLVLFNPSPFANITIKRQAANICSEINNNNMNMIFFNYRIGIYTSFFSCGEVDYNDPDSENSIKEDTIRSLDFIFKIREDNIVLINKFEEEAEFTRVRKLIDNEVYIIKRKCERFGFLQETVTYDQCVLNLL